MQWLETLSKRVIIIKAKYIINKSVAARRKLLCRLLNYDITVKLIYSNVKNINISVLCFGLNKGICLAFWTVMLWLRGQRDDHWTSSLFLVILILLSDPPISICLDGTFVSIMWHVWLNRMYLAMFVLSAAAIVSFGGLKLKMSADFHSCWPLKQSQLLPQLP